MKNLFNTGIIATMLLLPSALFAQTENALLWKVTQPNSKLTSYIFGSMHTNDSLANTFSDEWWKAIKSCEMLASEVDMTNPQELMASMTVAMMKDTTLADLYTPEELVIVDAFIKKNFDSFTALLTKKMKPFYIMAAAMEQPKKDSPYNAIMDMRLQGMAKEKGIKVIGLETFGQQAASIDVLSLKEQAAMLLEFAKQPETATLEEAAMLKHYVNQNLDSLAGMANSELYPEKLLTSIIDNRNNRFVTNLIPQIKTKRVFCAVGAMHLPGKTGLIAQLRANGFVVEPVEFHFGN
jgi:uncharacterized protein